MNDLTINPFANYGGIIVGERFIPRKAELRAIQNRVLPWDGGNLAVVGDYRIGKSSLVYNALMEQKEALLEKKIMPVWIDIGTYEDISSFFRAMIKKTREELEEQEWITPAIQRSFEQLMQAQRSWSEEVELVQRFFAKVRKNDVKVIVILDEFDHARYLFRDKLSGFQALRELSYRPEWKVTLITCSRRTIKDIELQTRAISTFAGICHDLYLGVFQPAEQEVFFEKLSQAGIPVDDDLKSQFAFFCGGHPFHMDQLGYALVEQFRESGTLDFARAAEMVEHGFIDKYDYIIRILREDDSLSKLLQILFGPVVDVDEIDIDRLSRFGFVRKSADGKYETYSRHFYTYLKIVERRENFWPAWKNMETRLRQLVRSTLEHHYGPDWLPDLEKAHPELSRNIFDRLRGELQVEQAYFESRAPRNLLEIAQPRDLFAIVDAYWEQFSSIVQQDHDEWSERARLLSVAGAPLSQDRDQSAQESQHRQAEALIQEILEYIEMG